MSKGPKPPDKQPPLNPRDPVDEPPIDPVECWDFELIDLTSAAKIAKNGASITGSISNNRVLVLNLGNALGFAPDDIGIQIIVAVQEINGKLSGNIVSGEGSDDIIVKLCVR